MNHPLWLEERREITQQQLETITRLSLEHEATRFLEARGFDQNGNPLPRIPKYPTKTA